MFWFRLFVEIKREYIIERERVKLNTDAKETCLQERSFCVYSVDQQLHDLKESDIIVPSAGRMVAASPAIRTDWFGLNFTLKRWKNLLRKTLDSIYNQIRIYTLSSTGNCSELPVFK